MKLNKTPEIEAIFFDLDNTIIKTSQIFFAATREVSEMYARILPQVSAVEVAQLLAQVDRKIHAVLSVNPNRWKAVITELERSLQLKKVDSIADTALERLARIYTEVPRFEPGARAVLKRAKDWGLLLGLVTHANVEWTLFKLEALGLDSTFDAVSIIDEDQVHKKPTDWVSAAHRLPARVPRTMVVGDNVVSDVVAAVQAGFGAAVWINDVDGWDVVREGKLPPQAYELEGIAQVPDLPHFKQFS